MTNRCSRRGLAVGKRAKVNVAAQQDLLWDMQLLGPDGNTRNDVWMYGVVKSSTATHVVLQLPAAERSLEFPKSKVQSVDENYHCKTMYVVMDKHTVKNVDGLEFETAWKSKDYHTSLQDAKACVVPRPQEASEVSACAAPAPTNTPTPPAANAPTQTRSRNVRRTLVPSAPAAATAGIRTRSSNRRQTPRAPERAPTPVPVGEDEIEPSGSESDSETDESMPDLDVIDTSDDDSDSEDYMTDDGVEAEVDHPAETIAWKQSAQWQKDAEKDEFVRACGEAKWTAPANRESVKSLPTGPEQGCHFDVDVSREAIALLLEALPISFFKRLSNQSLQYAKSKNAFDGNTRFIKREWFTAANYIRLFAAVLMRGLVSARDDPAFFKGVKHGKYKQTGAEEVVGLTLNKYQQLLRYMHIVDNKRKRSPSSPDFDKCWKVRPLISMLQEVFKRWVIPGKNNAMDEAGIPSRSRWLRTYNPSKPTKYFIEILMACDSITRFCWAFFVTESAKKTVRNRHRAGRSKSKFLKVAHYQHEYEQDERNAQCRFGSAPAQMLHFARKLREDHDSPIVYRIFTDRRWDSIPGIILAKKKFNVSYTATVNVKSRYHVVKHWMKKGAPVIPKSKARNKRGKYRSATTTIDGVVLNTCLWNDSNRLGGVSADLGCENRPVTRRMGRHTPTISCPIMMFIRNKYLRGVDVHDQLRACKWRIVFQTKSKAWPKLVFGLYEITIINIYIVKCQDPDFDKAADTYRWSLVTGLVDKADSLDRISKDVSPVLDMTNDSDANDKVVPRFQGADSHHWELLHEYVTPEQAAINAAIVAANPTKRELTRRPRARDRNRKDGKVRNPLWTSASVCLVCKYHYNRIVETSRYCRECCVDKFTDWPKTNRATGFQKQFHPRLCSPECFRFFHTNTVRGLDYSQRRKRSRRGATPNTPVTTNTPRVRSRRGSTATPVITTPVVGPNGVRGHMDGNRHLPRTYNV